MCLLYIYVNLLIAGEEHNLQKWNKSIAGRVHWDPKLQTRRSTKPHKDTHSNPLEKPQNMLHLLTTTFPIALNTTERQEDQTIITVPPEQYGFYARK